MNEYPRLGFFDVDPERFDAMMKELVETGAIAMHDDPHWEDVIEDHMVEDEAIANHDDPRWDDVIEDNMVEDYYDESMDGDFDSAMASAGFGTDEDYGLYDDYDDFYGEDY